VKPDDLGLTADQTALGLQRATVAVRRAGSARVVEDWLADEVPVAMVFNGLTHGVMLATPADLEDYALGFALGEGLLGHAGEWRGAEAVAVPGGIELRSEVSAACEHRLRERRRVLAGGSGCGLCGSESLLQVAALAQGLAAVPGRNLSARALAAGMQALADAQPLQQQCGATHAAAWCDAAGRLLCVREDVGRHNAMDKLVGALARGGIDRDDGLALVTSRASWEMVLKAVRAGMPALAAVSAPTAPAVALADRANLLLAGFVREGDAVVYTFPERLQD
jgi:FdhD protein